MSLNLRILNTTCQAVNGSCRPERGRFSYIGFIVQSFTNVQDVNGLEFHACALPAPEENMFGLFDDFLQQALTVLH